MRSDAIRLWQDAKTAAERAGKERDDTLKQCRALSNEIGKLQHLLAFEQELRKAAEGKISGANAKTAEANATIELLNRQLVQRRDCSDENKRFGQRVLSLKQRNELLQTQVNSLKAHDFKADLEQARTNLATERIGREKDAQSGAEREKSLRQTLAEQSQEILVLGKRVKELTSQLETEERKALRAVVTEAAKEPSTPG